MYQVQSNVSIDDCESNNINLSVISVGHSGIL